MNRLVIALCVVASLSLVQGCATNKPITIPEMFAQCTAIYEAVQKFSLPAIERAQLRSHTMGVPVPSTTYE